MMLVTALCHAVLLLPLPGLPLFWLLPLGYALPINIAAWLATPFLYKAIRGLNAEAASRRNPVLALAK